MMNLTKYFDLPEDDSTIIQRIAVSPQPITDLAKYETEEGCKLLEQKHKKVYVVTPQIVRIIRRIFGIARAHLNSAYASEWLYKECCYIKNLIPRDPWLPTALVGLGGTGKTQLIMALERLCVTGGAKIELEGMPAYPVEPLWIMTMSMGSSLNALLMPFLAEAKGGNVLIVAAKIAFTNGVSLLVLDESQFITSTQEGHAKAAKTLMEATYIGPPFLFCANYTMINKLEKRPQQERDRLLSNIIPLMPEARGSEAYRDTFDGQLRVFGNAVASDSAVTAEKYSEPMHNFVYGIDRKTAILLQHAWRICRAEGAEILNFGHIERAYHSELFTSHRVEVEFLKEQSIQKRKLRDDLWCNFVPPMPCNVHQVKSFDDEKKKRANMALSRSALTKDEREAYDYLTSEVAKRKRTTGTVVNLTKTDKSLNALQTAGAEMMEQFKSEK